MEKMFCEVCGCEMEILMIQNCLDPESPYKFESSAFCAACDITLYLEGGGEEN